MAERNVQQRNSLVDVNKTSHTYHWSHKLIFTGPSGLRDHRPHQVDNVQAVGIGNISVEQTLDIGYVFRAAPGATFGRPRGLMPGEIGWGIPWLVNLGTPKPGQLIDVADRISVPTYKFTPGK